MDTLNSFKEEQKAIHSGFRSSGLWPFNPHEVEYDVLKKKKKNKQENVVNEVSPKQDSTIDITTKDVLTLYEKNLSQELLELFKEAEKTGFWEYDIENLGLFNHWLKMKQESCDNSPSQTKVKPTIKSIITIKDNQIEYKPTECLEETLTSEEVIINITDDALAELTNTVDENLIPLVIVPQNNELNSYEFVHIQNLSKDIVSKPPFQEEPLPVVQEYIDHKNLPATSSHLNHNKISNELHFHDNPTINSNNSILDLSLSKDKIVNTTDAPSHSYNSFKTLDRETESTSFLEDSVRTLLPISSNLHDVTNNQVSLNTNTQSHNNQILSNQTLGNEAEKENEVEKRNAFSECFTMPFDYLPKSKRSRLEKQNKEKKIASGPMDEWYKIQIKKEEEKKSKEEKIAKKKLLQEQKKAIAIKKKELQDQINEISKKIKQEKL